MSDKEMALQHINEIHAVIKNSVKDTFSGTRVLAIGLGIMAVPAVEFLFSHTIDGWVSHHTTQYAEPLLFIARTLFYWGLFSQLGRLFPKKNSPQHPFMKRLTKSFRWYPLIPVATAAALAYTGYADLISPFILILIGSLHVIIGQFTPLAMRIIAWSWIIVGLMGIIITPLQIAHLWQYLVLFQGLSLAGVGLYVQHTQ